MHPLLLNLLSGFYVVFFLKVNWAYKPNHLFLYTVVYDILNAAPMVVSSEHYIVSIYLLLSLQIHYLSSSNEVHVCICPNVLEIVHL